MRKARSTARERGDHSRESYRQGCRCRYCVKAFRHYHRKRYARLQVTRVGVTNRRVPAGPAAEHFAALTAAGWTVAKIAADVGCSSSTVQRIMRMQRRGEPGRCWSTFADAVLAITVGRLRDLHDV